MHRHRPIGDDTMAQYNVFENEKLIETVEAKSAQKAIKKVERSHGSLFNAFAVNTSDPNDTHGEAIDNRYGHAE